MLVLWCVFVVVGGCLLFVCFCGVLLLFVWCVVCVFVVLWCVFLWGVWCVVLWGVFGWCQRLTMSMFALNNSKHANNNHK